MKRFLGLGMMLASMIILAIALVACGVTTPTADSGIAKYSISPRIAENHGVKTVMVDCMDLRMTDDSLANGYVDIKFNEDRAEEGYKYIVWVYSEGQENQAFQFTLNNFKDWVMMPLPYTNQHLVVFRQTDTNYEKSFTSSESIVNDLGFPYMNDKYVVETETVCCYAINGVGNYLDNPDCFINKTVWIYWEDTSTMAKTAEWFMNYYEHNEKAFEIGVMEYINGIVKYDTEKLGKRASDKYYDLMAKDDTIYNEKGVCSDMSTVFCAMMRSQGIPCQYVEGFASGKTVNGIEFNGGHAWNITLHGDVNNAYDVTAGHDFIEQGYVVETIK